MALDQPAAKAVVHKAADSLAVADKAADRPAAVVDSFAAVDNFAVVDNFAADSFVVVAVAVPAVAEPVHLLVSHNFGRSAPHPAAYKNTFYKT